MSSSPIIEDAHAPKAGLELTVASANLILERHVSKSCKSLEKVNRGYNNQTFIVSTIDDSTYVIRLQGIHWTKFKTEGEVAAIIYLQTKCPELPLPRIYGYCSDKSKSGINNEYILMEYLPGQPLDEVLKTLTDIQDQKIILSQIVRFVASMKALTFDTIGSFGFTPRVSDTSGLDIGVFQNIQLDDIIIGPVVDQGVGPFKTWLEYFKTICQVEMKKLDSCEFMAPQRERLPRIAAFVDVMSDSTQTHFPEEVSSPRFIFTHGDFEPRNLLVEGTTITGLLDLEFSGSFPLESDWCDGFSDFDSATTEAVVFREDSEIGDEVKVTNDIKNLRDYFLSECKKYGATIPSEIPGHMNRAELYYFWANICPWYLSGEREQIPENWFKEREKSLNRVEYVLSKYGF